MIIWICTDMEGLAGVDRWNQCYDPDDRSPEYLYGLEQLTADTNAAIAGCFDAGATEVRVLDGHGRNLNRGFLGGKLDARGKVVWLEKGPPLRFDGFDENVHAAAMIGQHAMAGTLGGFLDHTQIPKEITRLTVNGIEYGELGQFALYAGALGVPLVYASGDEALCIEARTALTGIVTTPTKQGLGWESCHLYQPNEVRLNIRKDIAQALKKQHHVQPLRSKQALAIEVEFAWSGLADRFDKISWVKRNHARRIAWEISDARDIYSWPSDQWQPVSKDAKS